MTNETMTPTVASDAPAIEKRDPRRNAYRRDLAALSLKGRVEATRFVDGEQRQVMRAAVPLRAEPRVNVGLDNEVLFGEIVTVYDEKDGWAWVQLTRDNYVGYMRADALSALDESGAPFIAFVDAERGRLHVAYRRYDGHHGLVTPADAA